MCHAAREAHHARSARLSVASTAASAPRHHACSAAAAAAALLRQRDTPDGRRAARRLAVARPAVCACGAVDGQVWKGGRVERVKG